jgi:hypothetical protein
MFDFQWKPFFKKYGVMFVGVYFGSFVFLITFYNRFEFPTFPGDILLSSKKLNILIYFPFASSLAIALFTVIMFEAYKVFKQA